MSGYLATLFKLKIRYKSSIVVQKCCHLIFYFFHYFFYFCLSLLRLATLTPLVSLTDTVSF
jgi:hypothetical protein